MNTTKFWGIPLLALVAMLFVGGLGSANAQVCPEGTANCPDQVVARDLTRPYQMDPRTKVRKVLLYDNSNTHSEGRQAYRQAMIVLARKYGFELTISGAALGYITTSTLQGQNLVIFSQGDRDVVPAESSSTALQNYIYRDGNAMLMVHAASAFITCPGPGTGGGGSDIANATCRFMARAVARQYYHHESQNSPARLYADSVLAGTTPPHLTRQAATGTAVAPWTTVPPTAVMNHGKVNVETQNIFSNTVQYNWPLPANSTTDPRTTVWDNVGDEHYTWYNDPGPRAIPAMQRTWNNVSYTEGRLNILMSLDETSRYLVSTNEDRRIGDHPESWVRKMGNGLSAYNNMGHNRYPFNTARTGSGLGVDSMGQAYLWNLIRYLARDYQGCTNPAYSEYVPWASVASITPTDTAGGTNTCKTPVAIVHSNKRETFSGVSAFSNGVRIATPEAGFYRVHVSDLQGRFVYGRTVIGGVNKNVNVDGLTKGSYIVNVTTPAKKLNTVRVTL
jgi:hypothetical protein